ncbi:MAG: hypothetical protein ACTHU0_00945 [Kofleriaceae bacterium]
MKPPNIVEKLFRLVGRGRGPPGIRTCKRVLASCTEMANDAVDVDAVQVGGAELRGRSRDGGREGLGRTSTHRRGDRVPELREAERRLEDGRHRVQHAKRDFRPMQQTLPGLDLSALDPPREVDLLVGREQRVSG